MCAKSVVNANICKGNKRIIKDDNLQTLGISFSIPSGVATVGGGVRRAPKCTATTALCGLRARQEIRKWARGPSRRWSRHPDKTRKHLYSNWIPRNIPRSRPQRLGSETGYGLWNAHPTFRLASVCVYSLLPVIIRLFPYYSLNHMRFTFILPNLHISPVNAFWPLTIIGK